jgi:cytochrome c553
MVYTRNAIADFRAGRRFGEEAMLQKMSDIDDDEAEALVQFYASPAD